MPNVIPMAVRVNGGVIPMQAGNVPVDGSITTAKLADGAVTTAKLADGAVTLDKLDVAVALTVTDGDLTISLT